MSLSKEGGFYQARSTFNLRHNQRLCLIGVISLLLAFPAILQAHDCQETIESIARHHQWLRDAQLFEHSEAFAQRQLQEPGTLSLEALVMLRVQYSQTLAAHSRLTVEPDRSELLQTARDVIEPDSLGISQPVVVQLLSCLQQQLSAERLISQLQLKRIEWIVPQQPEQLYAEILACLQAWEDQEIQLSQLLIGSSESSRNWDWNCFPKPLIQKMIQRSQLQRCALVLELLDTYQLDERQQMTVLEPLQSTIERLQKQSMLNGAPTPIARQAEAQLIALERVENSLEEFSRQYQSAIESTVDPVFVAQWKQQMARKLIAADQPAHAVEILNELLKSAPELQSLRALRILGLAKLGRQFHTKDAQLADKLYEEAVGQLQHFPERSYWRSWSRYRIDYYELIRQVPAEYQSSIARLMQMDQSSSLQIASDQWKDLVLNAERSQQWSIAAVLPFAARAWLQTGNDQLVIEQLSDQKPWWQQQKRTSTIDWLRIQALESQFRQQATESLLGEYLRELQQHRVDYSNSEYQQEVDWKLAELSLAAGEYPEAWSHYQKLITANDHQQAAIRRLLWLNSELIGQLNAAGLSTRTWQQHALNFWGMSFEHVKSIPEELKWSIKAQMLELALEQPRQPILLIRQLSEGFDVSSTASILSREQQKQFLCVSVARMIAQGTELSALKPYVQDQLEALKLSSADIVVPFWQLKQLNERAERPAWHALTRWLVNQIPDQQRSVDLILLESELFVAEFETTKAIAMLQDALNQSPEQMTLLNRFYSLLLQTGTKSYLKSLISHARQSEMRFESGSVNWYRMRIWQVQALIALKQNENARKLIQQTELLSPMSVQKLGDDLGELSLRWQELKQQTDDPDNR